MLCRNLSYFKEKYGTGLMIEQIVDAIHAVGAERTIIATDLGADAGVNPNPVIGFRDYIIKLSESGFSNEEIFQMSAINPKRLISEADVT